MGEKVYQFCEKRNKGKMRKWIIFVSYVILVIVFSLFGMRYHFFYYPEEEYQLLEKEAQRVVEESGYGLEFETEYQCIIDFYNTQSNALIFRLVDSEYKIYHQYESDNKYIQPVPLSIKIQVEDWKATNREIKEIKREDASKTVHIVKELISIATLPILIIAIVWCVIISIIDLYHIINKNKRKA